MDPLSRTIYRPLDDYLDSREFTTRDVYNPPPVHDPATYLDLLAAERWDGAADVRDLGLEDGGAVVYELSSDESSVAFSVFVASGPRPSVLTDGDRTYRGPSEVYTCYGIEAELGPGEPSSVSRETYEECPAELLTQLSDDAAFASAEVFDG